MSEAIILTEETTNAVVDKVKLSYRTDHYHCTSAKTNWKTLEKSEPSWDFFNILVLGEISKIYSCFKMSSTVAPLKREYEGYKKGTPLKFFLYIFKTNLAKKGGNSQKWINSILREGMSSSSHP